MDEVQRALGRIEGKLDGISDDIRDTRARLAGHGQRIAGLEKSRSKFLGAAAVAVAGFNFAVFWLREKIFG